MHSLHRTHVLTAAFVLSAQLLAGGCPSSQFDLTITTRGQGSVEVSPPGGTYSASTTVTLTPQPDAGFVFDHWEGDASGTAAPTQLVMDGDKAVTAVFVPGFRGPTLTITIQGAGTVDVSPQPPWFVDDVVTMTPRPATGFVFDHWEGDASGTAAPTQILLDSDKSVTAVFVPAAQGPVLTITIQGTGTVDVSPLPPWAVGDVVTLTPRPAAGFVFDHWEGDLTGTAAPAQLTLTAAPQVVAVFVPVQFTVTVQVTGQGTVTLSPPGGTYDVGTVVEATATPDAGWLFGAWSGDLAGTQPVQSFTVASDVSVAATFVPATTYTLSVDVVGGDGSEGSGGSVLLDPPGGTYPAGTVVTLQPMPDATHRFDAWLSSDLVGNDQPARITMDGNKEVTAYFSFLDNSSFNPSNLTAVGEQVFFVAQTPWTGRELWVSNGALAGTHLVKDLAPGFASTEVRFIAGLGGRAFMFAYHDSQWRMFSSDGSPAGTAPVADLGDAFPLTTPVVVGDAIYFTTLDATGATAVWRSDGTPAGTVEIEGSTAGLNYALAAGVDTLFIITSDSANPTAPFRLWRTDGAVGGATLLHESSWIGEVRERDGAVVFTADDGSVERRGSIWAIDGNSAPVRLAAFSQLVNGGPGQLTTSASRFYFSPVEDGVLYNRLWYTEGAAPMIVDPTLSQVGDLIDVGGALFFKATYGLDISSGSWGLFRVTDQGATLLGQLNPVQGRALSTSQAAVSGLLLFGAESPTGGIGLWASDGTAAGTGLVAGLSTAGTGPLELIDVAGVAYFSATDGAHGQQLWRSDGTPANTRPVSRPHP